MFRELGRPEKSGKTLVSAVRDLVRVRVGMVIRTEDAVIDGVIGRVAIPAGFTVAVWTLARDASVGALYPEGFV